jgi:hypothetical protein
MSLMLLIERAGSAFADAWKIGSLNRPTADSGAKFGKGLARPFRVGIALLLPCMLSACGLASQCDVRSMTDLELIDDMIGKIVREIAATKRPGEVIYSGVQDFKSKNSNCCSVERPENYRGQGFTFPSGDEIELAIIFLRRTGGDTPYEIQHISIGPCADDYEESRYALSETDAKLALRAKQAWRIK